MYLIGDEYHDDYRPSYTFIGTPEELKVELEEAEYYMQGYVWWQDLHGPVMNDDALIAVHGGNGFTSTTFGDLLQEALS
jgi:hypothetical protein